MFFIFLIQNTGGDIMQQSILGQILPEAMVCYLENYGADKFAEIFLGEFDTPEVKIFVWSYDSVFSCSYSVFFNLNLMMCILVLDDDYNLKIEVNALEN